MFERLKTKQGLRRKIADSRGRLYRTAYSWCHDHYQADDLVQQTQFKALQKLSQLKNEAALSGWLFSIMSRCFIDQKRRGQYLDDTEQAEEIEEYSPEIAADEAELVQQVRQAVQCLPLPQRQVLTLVDLESFSYAETAEILDIPVGTVMSRLNRGRNALRDKLLATETNITLIKPPSTITRKLK